MIRAIRERGIKEALIVRIEEIINEAKSRVRVGGEVEEKFWTAKGVRQRCSLSPMLFNILMADVEKIMRKLKWGGVRLGE